MNQDLNDLKRIILQNPVVVKVCPFIIGVVVRVIILKI